MHCLIDLDDDILHSVDFLARLLRVQGGQEWQEKRADGQHGQAAGPAQARGVVPRMIMVSLLLRSETWPRPLANGGTAAGADDRKSRVSKSAEA